MRTFLLLINCLIIPLLGYSQNEFLPSQTGEVIKYTSTIAFRDVSISGICIIKYDVADKIVGTIINEFGVKAFDFIYNKTKKKIKCYNAIKMMNKWYIKQIIKSDLRFLLSHSSNIETIDEGHHHLFFNQGVWKLSNSKYDIIYKFYPFKKTEDNDAVK